MLIPPKYSLTPKISSLLSSIEASREIIDSITIPPEIETNIRRQSTLRSSLFSARIEGNDLTLDEFSGSSSRNQKKAEVFNILKALNFLLEKGKKDLNIADILSTHKLALDGLTERNNLGKLRSEVSAIFNSQGIAIYLPPQPRLIKPLIARLLKYSNGTKEQFVPIRACLTHFSFEKIHPFLDGNGRVGRLLIQKVLSQGGYGMKGLLSIEEFLDTHRTEYYRALEEPERDVTYYLEFMLQAIEETARVTKEKVMQKQKADVVDFLLPRRAEIYQIIKDQRLVNFDQIRRRFLLINERTLRYDLKKLQESGFVTKLGSTKGVYYKLTEK